MTESFFRTEAVAAKAHTLFGEATIATPLRYGIISFVALVTAVSLLSLVVFGSYSKKHTVTGYVTTTSANIRVYAPLAGTISEIHVHEGQQVVAGDSLAMVSMARANSEFDLVPEAILRSLYEELEALNRQVSANKKILENRAGSIAEQIKNVAYQIELLELQREDSKERLQLTEKNYSRLRGLGEELVPSVAVDQARAEVLTTRLALHTLNSQLANGLNELAQLQFDHQQLPQESLRTVAELDTGIAQIRQRISDVKGQASTMILSPIDGHVSTLGRREGQRIAPDMPLFTILPSDSRFYAELYVPSRSIGFVKNRSEVQVRFDAFPYQKYGVFRGKVVRVAKTATRPLDADAPIPLTEPTYLVSVELADQRLINDDNEFVLQVGMTLQADIIQEKRRILEWLLDPMLSAARSTQ